MMFYVPCKAFKRPFTLPANSDVLFSGSARHPFGQPLGSV
jgi:hypothetical protein